MKITAIHFRKLSAVTEMKMRTLMSKNFIIMPIFSLGFTLLMKILYRSIADGKINMDGYALSLGVLMNISMSVYCTAAALAEEKEKNTSVSDNEGIDIVEGKTKTINKAVNYNSSTINIGSNFNSYS